jgi:hypothetical protein
MVALQDLVTAFNLLLPNEYWILMQFIVPILNCGPVDTDQNQFRFGQPLIDVGQVTYP